MSRPSKGFKLRMDQTGPSSDILWSHASHLNIARVLTGWQLPTLVCQSFTRQIRVYQHEKVGEKVGENKGKFYLSPTVCQRVCRLFLCRSHTPTWVYQHEIANFSLPCEGRFNLIWNIWLHGALAIRPRSTSPNRSPPCCFSSEGHQHGVSVQSSINFCETLFRITRKRKTAQT